MICKIAKTIFKRLFLSSFLAGLFLAAVFFLAPIYKAQAASLSGRILLQVESHGEAWYVNPTDGKRYYMGRPDDAFALMRSFGLGASDGDIGSYQVSKAPSRLAGRILLQVQDKGQAFYVYPLDLKLYYLGRPSDAFGVMRSLGLGISNSDLAKIAVGASSKSPSSETATSPVLTAPTASGTNYEKVFEFKYKNRSWFLTQTFYESFYKTYSSLPKTYSYYSGTDIYGARNSFYGLFLSQVDGDNSIDEIVYKFKSLAAAQSWSEDETVEAAMSFVQLIPYDSNKAVGESANINPYYPYETLYLGRGVCSDKTFLAVLILRQLGYGAAVFDFPDANHSAAAISCPLENSIASSGYCYIETTNYFPIGVVPKSLAGGVATEDENNFENLFNADRLGKLEIYQKTAGKIYGRLSQTIAKAEEISQLDKEIKSSSVLVFDLEAALKAKGTEIDAFKAEMDAYFAAGQISKYNSMVLEYNVMVAEYNADLSIYQEKAQIFNDKANLFNQAVSEFYQK